MIVLIFLLCAVASITALDLDLLGIDTRPMVCDDNKAIVEKAVVHFGKGFAFCFQKNSITNCLLRYPNENIEFDITLCKYDEIGSNVNFIFHSANSVKDDLKDFLYFEAVRSKRNEDKICRVYSCTEKRKTMFYADFEECGMVRSMYKSIKHEKTCSNAGGQFVAGSKFFFNPGVSKEWIQKDETLNFVVKIGNEATCKMDFTMRGVF